MFQFFITTIWSVTRVIFIWNFLWFLAFFGYQRHKNILNQDLFSLTNFRLIFHGNSNNSEIEWKIELGIDLRNKKIKEKISKKSRNMAWITSIEKTPWNLPLWRECWVMLSNAKYFWQLAKAPQGTCLFIPPRQYQSL